LKPSTVMGLILIVLGVIALAYQGFSYTTREKAVDLGPIEITTEQKKTVPISPILGGLALAGGVVLVVAGGRRSA
jgi:hypothetical protein